MSTLIAHKNTDSFPKENVGGKAKNLYALENLGCTIPKWCVIPAGMEQTDTPAILKEIEAFFGTEFTQKRYSVRSSGLDEDGANFSFAGQFETYLNVSASEIEEKIEAVWASANSDRVIKYRQENGLSLNQGIGVIVQEMVNAQVAGVGFGIDPVSGDQETVVISSLYGLGEGLVSGELDADTFRIKNGEIISELATKTHRFDSDNNGSGILKNTVPTERHHRPSLSENQLIELSELLRNLERHFKKPQDIEFAVFDGTIYLLQARPITSNHKKGEYILWDNSNIIESYPGVTTPLTFSFIIKMYEHVYRQFTALLGVSKAELDHHTEVFENTLGLVRGRVYYNLLAWYKMLAMVPGYSLNAEFMENMMGVKERFELKDDYKMGKGKAWLRIVFMVFRMIYLQLNLRSERKRFMRHLNSVMAEYEAYNFSELDIAAIVKLYKSFETRLLLEWKAPLINDFFAMIWFGLLQKQTQKICPEEPNIHNDLLCGSQDIISVEPIHKSIEIASLISANEQAKSLFENENPKTIWEAFEEGKYPEIKDKIDAFILKFGERCVGELKLETISYRQDPLLFYKILKSYVQQGITGTKTSSTVDVDLRQKAEQVIAEKLNGKGIKKWWFGVALNKARDLVSNRENLRYERTRGFGMVRKMMTAIGVQLHSENKINNARDVFYLELEEIKTMDSTPFSETLKTKIEQRKLEFEDYRQQPIPEERFYTYGYNFTDEYIYSTDKIEPIEGDLEGIGCCPGRVKGKVRLILDPNELDSLNGDILVTSSTDPGWVTLFPTASAIIVERGSLLSHSAIVSREMGIPCIVSVTGLLRTLKTGDVIEMDGATGKIKIVTNE